MVSIIVSSYKPDVFNYFCRSLENTISIPFEIIKIDNAGIMGICEAYNKGASAAKYPFLLFCHEDVVFHKKGWGQKLVSFFEESENVGVIGIAGSKIKAKLPTGWTSGLKDYDFFSLIQSDKYGNTRIAENWDGTTSNFIPVKVLDGVFLMTTNQVWRKFKFNEDLKGYHLYDLDFSIRVSEQLVCYVTNTIPLEHLSTGNFGNEWIENTLAFNLDSYKNIDVLDWTRMSAIRKFWYYRLMSEDVSFPQRLKFAREMKFDKRSFFAMTRFLLGK